MRASIFLSVALGAWLAAGSRQPETTLVPSTSTPAQSCDPAGRSQVLPLGLNRADWSSIRAAWDAGRHTAFPVEAGWCARNPGQAWHTLFDGRGISLRPDAGGWEWGLELVRWGFAGAERSVSEPLRTRAEGQRVSYAWDEILEEWYVNDARGLEHGFTLDQRPQSKHRAEPGPLALLLRVRGNLLPQVLDDKRGVRFVDRDGAPMLTYAGLSVIDARGRELVAGFELASEGLLLSIDEREAHYPLTIDPLAQQAYLKASNTESADRFGESVAISGDTVVVGASSEDSAATGVNGDQSNNGAFASGAAYVFVRNGTTWSQQAYLKASNPDIEDRFGAPVAISADTIVIGATEEDSNATGVNGQQGNNLSMASGAAYVFVRNGTTWSQEAYLKASNAEAFDRFGSDVAVSGDVVAVGAADDSNATGVNGNQANNSASSSGAVYLFRRNAGSWSQEAYVKASNTQSGDAFGDSIAIEGETLVVGAFLEDSAATGVNGDQTNNDASNSGAVYVFRRNAGSWSQEAYMKASNPDSGDWFGTVALSGDTIVVGANAEESNATGVNGDQSNNDAEDAGAAYVFRRNAGSWGQEAYLKASNTEPDELFGSSVAVSGNTVVVGAPREDSAATGINGDQSDNSARYSGAAYVFERDGSTWDQTAYVKASNAERDDLFGSSVALSGSVLVVGAPQEGSNATGVNGDQTSNSAFRAGAAYAFVLGPCPAVAFRNAGSNPASYVASAVTVGSTFTATVDNNLAAQPTSLLFAFDTPTSFTLNGGQVLLCIDQAHGEIFTGQVLAPTTSTGGVDSYSLAVPNDPALAGFAFFSQAIQLGNPPFALSNAQDITVGS